MLKLSSVKGKELPPKVDNVVYCRVVISHPEVVILDVFTNAVAPSIVQVTIGGLV